MLGHDAGQRIVCGGLGAALMNACMKWCCCSGDQTDGSGWAPKAGGGGDGLGVSFGGVDGGYLALPLAGASTSVNKPRRDTETRLTVMRIRLALLAVRRGG